MSTQYDAIGATFKNMVKLPGSHLQYLWIKKTLEPLIQQQRLQQEARAESEQAGRKKIKALDLACGTGRYSSVLREWGVDYVLGIDISTAMIDAARESLASASSSSSSHKEEEDGDGVHFAVGDCSRPDVRYDQGPFDIVLACWLFNYAPSPAKMADMFRHAAGNVRGSGVLVALCPFATEDPAGFVAAADKVWPKAMGVLHFENTGVVKGPAIDGGSGGDGKEEQDLGITARIWAGVEPQPFSFDAYHLRKSVYEWALREGGFMGSARWLDCRWTPELDKEGVSDDKWELWKAKFDEIPTGSLLVVTKN